MRPRKKQTEKKEAGWKVMLITVAVKEERRVGKGEDTAGVRGAAVLWCQSPVEYPGHPGEQVYSLCDIIPNRLSPSLPHLLNFIY